MKILVCGDRYWADYDAVYQYLHSLDPSTIIIEGEASGADRMAAWAALALYMIYEPYPADWSKFGRAAGPKRNKLMLTQGKPDEVHAFHDNIDASRGTKNMLHQALKAGVPCYLHSHVSPTDRTMETRKVERV